MTDTFQEIKQIETEAETIVSSAEKKKEELIQEARRNATNYSKSESEKLESYKEKALVKARSDAESAKKKLLAANRKQVSALKQKGVNNMEKAVQHVIERFERLFE